MSHSCKTVFVSGCFDLLHSGHIEFLRQASEYGVLHVSLGSDQTICNLKGRLPENCQAERLFMVQAVRFVHKSFVATGSGSLDFETELRALRPDLFIVNTDGDHPGKRDLCRQLGIEYLVLERRPANHLISRSTSALRTQSQIPYRIDLAGGWLDQPFVSKLHPGAVIVVSILPADSYAERAGLATSTRKTAVKLWGQRLPSALDLETTALVLFGADNPPGIKVISGSQDALGIVMPGVSRLDYAGDYWPKSIECVTESTVLQWLEQKIFIRAYPSRTDQYNVHLDQQISVLSARSLSLAADECWEAILSQDGSRFGKALCDSFAAQTSMFPRMVTAELKQAIEELPSTVLGYKVAGAGGGGYLVVASETQPLGFDRVFVRSREL